MLTKLANATDALRSSPPFVTVPWQATHRGVKIWRWILENVALRDVVIVSEGALGELDEPPQPTKFKEANANNQMTRNLGELTKMPFIRNIDT